MSLYRSWDEVLKSGNKYDLIVADPPWKYDTDTKALSGCAENRKGGDGYITMALSDIKAMDVPAISSKNSAICMWTTGAMMGNAIDVMEAWGFEYKTVLFVWLKVNKDNKPRWVMGNYTRPSTEFILFGKRGKGIQIPKEDKIHNMHQLVMSKILGHSVKPPVFINQIERLFHNPEKKIEMFARVGFKGWDLFGNQCEYSGEISTG